MADRKLIVEIVGDDSSLQKALNRSSQAIDKFGKTQSKGVSTTNTPETQALLGKIRSNVQEGERIARDLSRLETQQQTRQDQLLKVAATGAKFFALGRGVSGAGAALEAFQGHASGASLALGDAGEAIQSLITLDPAGFFKAVGASAERSRKGLEGYARGLNDINQEATALGLAQAADSMGFGRQADLIRGTVQALKSAKVALDALEFSQREFNATTINGRNALVKFRGAADSIGLRGGLGGAGGVEIERNSRQAPITINVELDGKQVAKSVTVNQQKGRRSNPSQKRGGGASNSPDSR